MRKTATEQSGRIPAQPGPREAATMQAAGVPLDADAVIPGAGPSTRSGERPTVRLRDAGPDDAPRYAPEWLELREGPDAAARATDLLDPLRIRLANLPGKAGLVIHDLGCGTGSMGRWLAPRLDGPQHWILHDRDPYLLHFAAVASPRSAADGSRVTVETRRGDVGLLTPDVLAGASLVTASALLDVLTREEIDTLAAACTGAGCPALLTLSVAGRVELDPADPLDEEIADAFNAHQRRGALLGPDAVTVACEAFSERGATVRLHPSAWRLGPAESALTAQWLRGWVGAAVEERPELKERAEPYLRDRLEACRAGELKAIVHHSDLLALSRPTGGAS
ncbi:class I SAM-dependent methyltransferase [Streptomyces sp. NPDC091972]|uniref:class I SAM-dependent methyltransferase n=1 Tax=Streptomyces sp. NPDC091972 TaxID=3366007 RepID=UPI003824F26A